MKNSVLEDNPYHYDPDDADKRRRYDFKEQENALKYIAVEDYNNDLKVTLGFTVPMQHDHSSKAKKNKTPEYITALAPDVEWQNETNGSSGKYVARIPKENIYSLIQALSNANHDNAAPVISEHDAYISTSFEMAIAEKQPSQCKDVARMTLREIKGEEVELRGLKEPHSYISDYHIDYPYSRVEHLAESGELAYGKNRRPAMELHTLVHFRDEKSRDAALARFKNEGFEVRPLGHDGLKLPYRTADEAVEILAEDRLLPQFIADEIREKALELHEKQDLKNAELKETHHKWVASLQAVPPSAAGKPRTK